jgi:hypothetical protein
MRRKNNQNSEIAPAVCHSRNPDVAGRMTILLVAAVFAIPQVARAQLATVTVVTRPLGRQIPRDFVGFSLEISTGGQGLQAFASGHQGGVSPSSQGEVQYALGHPGAPNDGFFTFMRNLGPGILRLGGNSQDNTCWDPKQAPHPSWCRADLSSDDLKLFSDAAAASGWRLILGINLKQNSATWVLKEITEGVARDIQPGQILGLEIGNEPDLFPRDARPGTYSSADHVTDFLNYMQAFRRNPVARQYGIVGPATCCGWRNADDLAAFIDGVGPENLKLVTVHDYPTTTCGGRQASVAQLLAPTLIPRFNDLAKTWVAAVEARHLPIALAETNSASCGGMPGVSNAFAAALWGLDWMYSAARDGFSSINFHASYRPGGSSYNPIDTVGGEDASGKWHYQNIAQPLYYAMYLFARHAAGEHFLRSTTASTANIRAFATSSCEGCAVNVFLMNKDLAAQGEVRVRVTGRRGMASLLLLRAPSLSSGAPAVQYGGVQFDSDGHLPPPHLASFQPGAQGTYSFILPRASAALLTVEASENHK